MRMRIRNIRRTTDSYCYDYDEERGVTNWRGAYWLDWCAHGHDGIESHAEFHGTFTMDGVPHDVYTFGKRSLPEGEREMCIRFGNEPGNYYSPPQVAHCLEIAVRVHDPMYATALELIGLVSKEVAQFIRSLEKE